MENNLGNRETMARNIQYYMTVKGVQSIDVCDALGFPPSTFSYWLTAKTYPRIDKIEKMANYFGITKADLVEERTTKNQTVNDDLDNESIQLLNAFKSLPQDQRKLIVAQLQAFAQSQKGQDD